MYHDPILDQEDSFSIATQLVPDWFTAVCSQVQSFTGELWTGEPERWENSDDRCAVM